MSQTVWSTINPASTSGTQLASLLDDFKNAVMSGLSGTSRPTQTTAGGSWVDTTNEGSPDFYWSFKIYTGSIDVEIFRLNLATGLPSISGSDSTFELSRVSADAVGPILKMVKQRIASNGADLLNDDIGTIQFIGRGSDSSNPVVAYVKVIATDNYDGTKSGAQMVFYTTTALSNTATEHMRLLDGKLGVGTQAPNAIIHASGATGIKSEYRADNAVGAKLATSKRRIAGNGSTQNADVIGEHNFYTTDDASAEVLSAQVVATATEAHTASARGTKLDIKTSDIGATTPTTKITIDEKVEPIVALKVNSHELVSQNVATAATIAQLSATKVVVEMTGSTATDIQGINSGHASKVVLIHNRSTAFVNLLHENGTAAAADRMKLPSNTLVVIPPEGSVELYYCTADTRWKLKALATGASAGGGGGGLEWYFGDSNGPIEEVLSNGLRVVSFSQSPDEQEMFVELQVPTSYVAGTQIKLINGKFFGALTTGNVLWRTTSYIFKAAIDGTSVPTGHASVNTQVAVSGTANNIVAVGDVDLTDSAGEINSVAVGGGDTLLVKLQRLTSSETSGLAGDARLVRASFEPKFTA